MEGDEDVNKKQGANSDIGDDNSGKEEEDFYAWTHQNYNSQYGEDLDVWLHNVQEISPRGCDLLAMKGLRIVSSLSCKCIGCSEIHNLSTDRT